MCASNLSFHAPLLRTVAEGLKLLSIAKIAAQPGVREVYRITVHFFDGRACNSVATLRRSFDGSVLEVVYQQALGHKPIQHRISDERYDEFFKALKSLDFDKMRDQPNLPEHNTTDLWLIERAAGTFRHSVILAPELAQEDYARLANSVRNGLPEALRQVK
jgi:hypothetical protein